MWGPNLSARWQHTRGKVEFLQGLGLSAEECVTCILKSPGFLSNSLDTLRANAELWREKIPGIDFAAEIEQRRNRFLCSGTALLRERMEGQVVTRAWLGMVWKTEAVFRRWLSRRRPG